MFYGLQFVSDHPVYRLHEAFSHFLDVGLKFKTFGTHCFPKWFRPVVTASSGLFDRCRAVHSEAHKRKQAERDLVVAVWKSHSDVQRLCEDAKSKLVQWDCKSNKLVDALRELFNFLYESTLESKSFEKAAGKSLLDHYNAFRALGQRVCPFCGLNYYADRDGGARSSYDHFLPRLYYPLAAVNFRNLVPMCDDCNERPRKGTKDVLFKDNARTTRRRFFYPYSKLGGVLLSIKCTKRPQPSNPSGTWKVKAIATKAGEQPLVSGWDSVFDVEARFSARVRESLDGWMKDFLNSKGYSNQPTVTQLRKALSKKATWLSLPEQVHSRAEATLQAAAFRYMAVDAPHAMLAGYTAIATSAAITGTPTVLHLNRT